MWNDPFLPKQETARPSEAQENSAARGQEARKRVSRIIFMYTDLEVDCSVLHWTATKKIDFQNFLGHSSRRKQKLRSGLREPAIDFWASRFIYLALLTVWLSIPLASVKNARTPPPWDPVQPIQIAVAF